MNTAAADTGLAATTCPRGPRTTHTAQGDRSAMPAILALVLVAVAAVIVLSFALHILFSPWILLAVAIVAFIKFRPRRSHQ
ncbi:MAG TPA: hypothetical protein VFI65_03905 [Streptosporangiaceae bacterium]|nr:hypothetical protein [Streptosporangiaceae bacterium]